MAKKGFSKKNVLFKQKVKNQKQKKRKENFQKTIKNTKIKSSCKNKIGRLSWNPLADARKTHPRLSNPNCQPFARSATHHSRKWYRSLWFSNP